ncbi:MAG: mannan-binding lectin [Parasphingorhabdus sp.]|uniref:mannan-binding lectin n=1 Tax=Parasphingorhabdus sp. TaxID=2709688 RepID=UPI003001E2CA
MLNKAVALGLSIAATGLLSFAYPDAAQAQRQRATQLGVDGYTVTRANFSGGSLRTSGNGRWTEYDGNGRAAFNFTETDRDEWSVYLHDQSRNVQLQIDIHRKWVTYGTNDGPKSDLYQITSASRKSVPPPRAVTNGRNVQQVFFDRGSFKKTAHRQWAEFNAQGQAVFSFAETSRDEWSVYLNDRSRNVQLQLDLHRKWIGYSQNGGRKSDLYRITSFSQREGNSPPPLPSQHTRDINAGPIWNQQDAEIKCPAVAASQSGKWTGQWRTTVQGKMSVCEIRF